MAVQICLFPEPGTEAKKPKKSRKSVFFLIKSAFRPMKMGASSYKNNSNYLILTGRMPAWLTMPNPAKKRCDRYVLMLNQ
jgi:hypothetical protein